MRGGGGSRGVGPQPAEAARADGRAVAADARAARRLAGPDARAPHACPLPRAGPGTDARSDAGGAVENARADAAAHARAVARAHARADTQGSHARAIARTFCAHAAAEPRCLYWPDTGTQGAGKHRSEKWQRRWRNWV